MTVRIDARVARCFGTLKNPELTPLVDYLRASRIDLLESISTCSDMVLVHRLQGKAEILKELVSNIENSGALINKLQG